MENPEEILHSLEQFSKIRPKDIPGELEEYLCFVAKTGDPVYQWSIIKHLLREKLINVVTEFYESCSLGDIQPCKNVEKFDYDIMKSFILEKLDTFVSAPFTVQRICELLTTPRKEYNRIDKFMRALEKNILVVSTVEPGMKNAENGDSLVNGLESEHVPETRNCGTEIIVVEMEETSWHKNDESEPMQFQTEEESSSAEVQDTIMTEVEDIPKESDSAPACSSSQDTEPMVEEPKETEVETAVPLNSVNASEEECSESATSRGAEESLPDIQPENVINSEAVAWSELLTEASSEVITEASSEVITEASSEVVSEASSQVISEASSEVITETSSDVITESSSEMAAETSSEVTTEAADEEVVSSNDSKASEISSADNTENETAEEHLKQADSTTSLKLPQIEEVPTVCQLESTSDETQQSFKQQVLQNTIASSENDNTNTDSDSNQSSGSTEPDTVNEAQFSENSSNEAKEIISNESEESISYHEGLNSTQADTTRGYNTSEITFQNKIEENKDEEISSSDKVVVAVPNTSVDDISDDEAEAEAEVQKIDINEETQHGDAPMVTETSDVDSQVTASSDDVEKDPEATTMEVDPTDKGDFNEAEATPESI